jgi:CxxC-x17-CxxC domain-containing protein
MSQRSTTEIKCSDCGKTATVPFKPTPGKPVYCSECLSKHRTKPKGTYESSGSGSSQKQAWSRRRENWK